MEENKFYFAKKHGYFVRTWPPSPGGRTICSGGYVQAATHRTKGQSFYILGNIPQLLGIFATGKSG